MNLSDLFLLVEVSLLLEQKTLLTRTPHAVACALAECTDRWLFGTFTDLCGSRHDLNSRVFSSPKNRKPAPQRPTPLGPDYSTFSLCGFVCAGHLVGMKEYSAWPVVAGFPH